MMADASQLLTKYPFSQHIGAY